MEDQKLDYCEYPDEQLPYPFFPPQDEPVAVYVDTNLRTHLAVVMSPLQTFSALKHQISLEHFNCFPKSGRILIKEISLIINNKKYHLSDTMLIKSAFHGIDRPWVVLAEAYKPIGNSELPSHTDVKHIKPAPQNLELKHVEPPSQYHQEPKHLITSPQNNLKHVEAFSQYYPEPEHLNLSHQNHIPMHVQPSPQNHTLTHVDPSYQNHTLMHVDPSSPHHREPKTYVTPSHQLRPSSQDHKKRPVKPSSQIQGTPNKSEQKMKKKNKKKGKKDIANVNKKTNVVSNYGSQRKNVKKQLNEITDKQGQGAVSNAGKDTGSKPFNKPAEGHHDTSVMLMEDASDDIVTDLKGNSPNLPENINKESETLNFDSPPPGHEANKSKRKKKGGIDGVSQNHPATPVKGPAILEKADAPSNNGIETDREVSPAQWNNAPESLSQHVPLNSENTSKKRKASESEQQSRKTAEKIPSDLDNVPELLSQDEIRESRKTSECEKEIAEDVAPVKLENTAKKRKTSKAKNSSAENQDLSSRRPNDDKKVYVTKHLHGEVSQPDDIGKPEESVETMSVKVKKSRNKKAVAEDPLVAHVKVRPDEEIKEMATPIAVFQNDKSKKKSQKKQPVPTEDLSSVIENQHADESMMKEDIPVKVDETLTECDANDALLKTENTGKIQKTNDNDQQCRTADVSSSLLSDVSKVVLSQDESLKLVEKEKEIKEDDALSKLENNAKKRKNKAKSCGTENQEWSRRRQNEDEKTDDGSKVSGAILDMGMDTPKRADDVLTDSKSSDAQNQNGVKQGEEHDNFSQKPDLESIAGASAVIDEVLQQLQLEKPLTCKKKTKKTDQASSIDTSSNGYNLVGSKKNLGSANTSELQISNNVQKQDYSTPKKVVDSDRSKSSKARKIYREEEAIKPQNNVEEDNMSLRKSSHLTSKGVLNASEKKNGRLASSRVIFEDGNSSSSNDEDGNSTSSNYEDGGFASSSSGTLAPDNSDDSEVESGGFVKSNDDCSKGTRSIKAESSGLKLESILKSSSRYKKARLVASQSQGESELPEFVPDSQGYL